MKHLLLCGLVGLVIAPFWTQVEARDDDIITIPRFISFRINGYRMRLEFLGDDMVSVWDEREGGAHTVSFY